VTRDPRFDRLFEPVSIGPIVAKNRFYQVPHCNGMGYARPQSHAAMRGIKAEWAAVSTEESHIHPTSDISPFIQVVCGTTATFPSIQPTETID
jgi:dimethylamine/trimethylamine dehydrogenase